MFFITLPQNKMTEERHRISPLSLKVYVCKNTVPVVIICSVLFCHVHYNFRFTSICSICLSLLPFVLKGHVLLLLFVFILVSNTISISDDVVLSFYSNTTGLSLVEQRQVALPKYLSAPSVNWWVSCCSIICVLCRVMSTSIHLSVDMIFQSLCFLSRFP
jgi:hypothetical protein